MKDIKRIYNIVLSKTRVGVDTETLEITREEFYMLYDYLRLIKEPFTYTTCIQISKK